METCANVMALMGVALAIVLGVSCVTEESKRERSKLEVKCAKLVCPVGFKPGLGYAKYFGDICACTPSEEP